MGEVRHYLLLRRARARLALGAVRRHPSGNSSKITQQPWTVVTSLRKRKGLRVGLLFLRDQVKPKSTAGAAGQRRTPSLSGVARRTHRAAHAAAAFVASAAAAPCIRLRRQPPRDLPLARSSAHEKANDLLLLLRLLLLLLASEATVHIGSRDRVAAMPTAAPVAAPVPLAAPVAAAPLALAALAALALFRRLARSLRCAARGGCFTHHDCYTN